MTHNNPAIETPCPFCGGNDVHVEPVFSKSPDDVNLTITTFAVECYSCLAAGPMEDDEDEAIRKWRERKA